jgi:Zn-dependent peptidase ImmA (M78 family)
VEFERARVAVAHELAHVLIHKKADGYDEATIRLQSSPTEEALAEYGARLR